VGSGFWWPDWKSSSRKACLKPKSVERISIHHDPDPHMSTINLRDDPLNSFIVAASVPLDSSHASGTLEQANALLEAHPHLATANIYTAALLGDEAGVRRFLAADSSQATAKGGPHGWDALTYLCFSRYLRLDRTRTDGFVGAARAIICRRRNSKAFFTAPPGLLMNRS
jgi:hypothetical protein